MGPFFMFKYIIKFIYKPPKRTIRIFRQKYYVIVEKNIQIEYTNGIYQMLSLIVIEEDGKLISEYSNIKLEESVLFDLICYTLANTSVEIASKYRDYVKKLMHY